MRYFCVIAYQGLEETFCIQVSIDIPQARLIKPIEPIF